MINQKIALIGAAFGLASRNQDCARAPSVLRENGLQTRLSSLGIDLFDAGDVAENNCDLGTNPKLKYLPAILDFSQRFEAKMQELWLKSFFPVVLGGDHSISISTVAAAHNVLQQRLGAKPKLGLMWVDAHADINTPETSVSGNIHGMPVAALLGLGEKKLTSIGGEFPKLSPENVIYIGLRSVDSGERELINKLKIKAFSMTEVDRYGIGQVCEMAFSYLREKTDGFILSFDLDVCEPQLAPAVGTPVRGGLTYRESHYIMEMAALEKKLLSLELVEFNPSFDIEKRTCELAIGLLESGLGKTIL